MPDLPQSLQGHDLGHLRIIAELWGIDLSSSNTGAETQRTALFRLVPTLLDQTLVDEVVNALPHEARTALEDLLQNDGCLPWSLFIRRYGVVREMGPGRRDRERPYRKSASPTEMLWYRGLIARAFFDTPNGPEEFAYIPDDLRPLITLSRDVPVVPMGRAALPPERAHLFPVTDRILDHACTLLAALRLDLPVDPLSESLKSSFSSFPYPLTRIPLTILLSTAGLLSTNNQPLPEPTRSFLEARRGDALAQLVQSWLHSSTFNELRLMPGLNCEGEWQNDPLHTRQIILDYLAGLPTATWWSLPAFVADIRKRNPDYQRPAGDYDTWFIRNEITNEYLRGFEHWDDIDGALIRYLITGPIYWLGILDLASSAPDALPTSFRYSGWAAALLRGTSPEGMPTEDATIQVGSDARLRVPRLVPRAARYQIARFSEWDEETDEGYRYRLTPVSLSRAHQQGLTISHLLALLHRYTEVVPPSLVKALEGWDQHGTEARLEQLVVLRLSSPELLKQVRASRAARFLGDPLGPTAVIVKPGAWEKVLRVLAEMGYIGEARIESKE